MGNFYDNFLNANPTPKVKIINNLQAHIDKKFKVASTYQTTVEEETVFGSLSFSTIEARVVDVIDVKTGLRVNDDYKGLIFNEVDHPVVVGQRYKFSNNIWICYSTNSIMTVTANAYLHRCNTTMNLQDDYGNVHQEPCFIDYKILETRIYMKENIDVPRGRIEIKAQMNSWTNKININTRLMFDSISYRVRTRNGYDRRETFDTSTVKYIDFYAEIDNNNEYDNLELQVADYKEYNYAINTITNLTAKINSTGVIPYSVTLDGNSVSETVTWVSSNPDIISISSDGTYTALSVGSAVVTCIMANKTSVSSTINCTISDSDVYTTLFTPDISKIGSNNSQSYTVYEYLNGVKTDTTFSIVCSNAPQKCYIATIDTNSITIQALRISSLPLIITYTNNRTSESKTFNIELGGIS